jgi:hypothetical protein
MTAHNDLPRPDLGRSFTFYVAYMRDGSRWGHGLTSAAAIQMAGESLGELYANADLEERALHAHALDSLLVARVEVEDQGHTLPLVAGILDRRAVLVAKELDLRSELPIVSA